MDKKLLRKKFFARLCKESKCFNRIVHEDYNSDSIYNIQYKFLVNNNLLINTFLSFLNEQKVFKIYQNNVAKAKEIYNWHSDVYNTHPFYYISSAFPWGALTGNFNLWHRLAQQWRQFVNDKYEHFLKPYRKNEKI